MKDFATPGELYRTKMSITFFAGPNWRCDFNIREGELVILVNFSAKGPWHPDTETVSLGDQYALFLTTMGVGFRERTILQSIYFSKETS